MTTLTPVRTAILQDLQMVCAGRPVGDTLAAIADMLASVAGYASSDVRTAETLVDSLVPDIKRTIRDNWELIVEIRAVSGSTAGRA